MRRLLLLALCLLFLLPESTAKHIIGGEITYECLGDNLYRFTMRVYRDDTCTNCGVLDPQAAIGVFNCDYNNCFSSDLELILRPRLEGVTNIEPPEFECSRAPDNIRVEEGLYIFEERLPLSDESYHIVYQRCCRNVTINNILVPGEVGGTYTVEITPEAQRECNSSPVFNLFPPTVICANEALNFDHSASDMDGDSLVYSFCAPLTGGGDDTSDANVSNCVIGAVPNPPCPPPYQTVTFVSPLYGPSNPMGGTPRVRIDPNTGIITGTPTMLGQFVVGVCVREYRNGDQIGEIRRDFQFNVMSCTSKVTAIIPADSIVNGQEFLINSCGNETVTFRNNSLERASIREQIWTFNIDGVEQEFSDWEPTVTFPGLGQCTGQLILNPDSACKDSALIRVNVYPAIFAEFEFDYDTCVASPVVFTNSSYSEAGDLTGVTWDFDNGDASAEFEPEYLYDEPDLYNVRLEVRDQNNCIAEAVEPVSYFPIPPTIVIAPDFQIGCAPQEVFFNNLSWPISEDYDILWQFGDGNTGTSVSPTHTYEEEGTYTVSLDIVSPLGCAIDTVFEDLVTVRPSPVADFIYTPDELTVIDPTASFFERAQNAIRWIWTFEDREISFELKPTHTFIDTGLQKAQLVVEDESGCFDTLIQFIDILPEVRYFLPNAFTPNGDGTNDTYAGKGVVRGMRDFEMTIWNRWGETIFSTPSPEIAWNGRKQNIGASAPNGVYVVVVRYRDPRGNLVNLRELVTLIR